mgnify:CR=1 FL=1
MTVICIILAFYCVINQYFGELPWLATIVAFPWGAYGVSEACYYRKATKENTKNKHNCFHNSAAGYPERAFDSTLLILPKINQNLLLLMLK